MLRISKRARASLRRRVGGKAARAHSRDTRHAATGGKLVAFAAVSLERSENMRITELCAMKRKTPILRAFHWRAHPSPSKSVWTRAASCGADAVATEGTRDRGEGGIASHDQLSRHYLFAHFKDTLWVEGLHSAGSLAAGEPQNRRRASCRGTATRDRTSSIKPPPTSAFVRPLCYSTALKPCRLRACLEYG